MYEFSPCRHVKFKIRLLFSSPFSTLRETGYIFILAIDITHVILTDFLVISAEIKLHDFLFPTKYLPNTLEM